MYLGTIVNSRFTSNWFPIEGKKINQSMVSFKRLHACEKDSNVPGNTAIHSVVIIVAIVIPMAKGKRQNNET